MHVKTAKDIRVASLCCNPHTSGMQQRVAVPLTKLCKRVHLQVPGTQCKRSVEVKPQPNLEDVGLRSCAGSTSQRHEGSGNTVNRITKRHYIRGSPDWMRCAQNTTQDLQAFAQNHYAERFDSSAQRPPPPCTGPVVAEHQTPTDIAECAGASGSAGVRAVPDAAHSTCAERHAFTWARVAAAHPVTLAVHEQNATTLQAGVDSQT